jgi:hypothetical protein
MTGVSSTTMWGVARYRAVARVQGIRGREDLQSAGAGLTFIKEKLAPKGAAR